MDCSYSHWGGPARGQGAVRSDLCSSQGWPYMSVCNRSLQTWVSGNSFLRVEPWIASQSFVVPLQLINGLSSSYPILRVPSVSCRYPWLIQAVTMYERRASVSKGTKIPAFWGLHFSQFQIAMGSGACQSIWMCMPFWPSVTMKRMFRACKCVCVRCIIRTWGNPWCMDDFRSA